MKPKKVVIEDIYPLSPIQSGLLFQALYAPESDAYFVQSIFDIEDVNVELLEKAWQIVCHHHPILRTGFIWDDGQEPAQFVLESVAVPFTYHQLQQKKQFDDFLGKDRQQGFDLRKAPLFRVLLMKMPNHHFRMLWSHSHAITDGWSNAIILTDLIQAYNDLVEGKSAIHLPPRKPYSDYIAWIEQQDKTIDHAFWQNYLSQIDSPSKISECDTNAKKSTHQALHHIFHLPKLQTQALQHFAKSQGITLNTIIQGIFITLLRAYTQKKDIVLGVTVSGRSIPINGIEDMVGIFINTLPLCASFQKRVSALTFLHELQRNLQRLNEHSFSSLAEIQQLCGYNEGLFDAIFVFENYPVNQALKKPEQQALNLQFFNNIERTEYPLTIIVGPGEKLYIRLNYQSASFSPTFIERIEKHFLTLSEKLLESPEQPIDALDICYTKERMYLLHQLNDTDIHYPQEHSTIIKLIEEQAQRTPKQTALRFADTNMDYLTLNAKANQMAHNLIHQGVLPGTIVAVALERSMELIISLLAILKTGAAYLPLDTEAPHARLSFILRDANVPFLLVQQHLHHNLIPVIDAYHGHVIQNHSDTLPTCHPNVNFSVQQPAYIIYTSGSTGNPKGVVISHASLCNRLLWMQKQYHLQSHDRVLQKTPYTFDVSVWELFWPLISGATSVILPANMHKDPQFLSSFIKQQRISVLHFVPSMLKQFLHALPGPLSPAPRLTFASGENLPGYLVADYYEKMSPGTLHNLYGPTEATIDVTAFACPATITSSYTPIGHPIANTQIYILDQDLNPVPEGVVGELYIGGIGLAQGYLGRADLSAAAFIPNPFGRDHHQLRLYRSGDLARYLAKGNIECLGRIDDQIKIRGFRIEMGEIEAIINKHTDIRQAAVLAQNDNTQLVAYLVPHHPYSGDALLIEDETAAQLIDAVRCHIAKFLPEYMIPNHFACLRYLPTTVNGKIDHKALPNTLQRQLLNRYVAPQSPTEQKLVGIWQDVLGVDSIGINDHFFKLGGHSLLATQIISRIRLAFDVDLPLKVLFAQPTIHALAKAIADQAPHAPKKPIHAKKRPTTIPLSFAQQRLWFIHELMPDVALYNIPIALRLQGNLNVLALEKALNYLSQRHEALRTVFPDAHGQATQVLLDNLPVNLNDHIVDLSALPEQQQSSQSEKIARQEAHLPFDLNKGPLFRVRLLGLSDAHVLLLTFHHIIMDGWSLDLFFTELSLSYAAYLKQQTPALKALAVQYIDYTLWQHENLTEAALSHEMLYWQKQLQDAPSLLELDICKKRPQTMNHHAKSHRLHLNIQTKKALEQLSQQHGASLFMTLLTIFKVLLHRYSHADTLVVGTPIANRQHHEIENVLGFFVNTLAIKTSFTAFASFVDILQQVRDTTLEAYNHQNIPFEQVVDSLNLPRQLNQNPLFQVMCSIEGGLSTESYDTPLSLQDIVISPLLDERESMAKVDLNLAIFPSSQGITLDFEYDSELFLTETVTYFAEHFAVLTGKILDNPLEPLCMHSLLTPKQMHQVLHTWNDSQRPYHEETTIHALFCRQVRKTPDQIAVIYENQHLTYDTLNKKANIVAHHLRKLGVGPDVLVAIAMQRSEKAIIAILAILKAGGAYVPLDPEHPPARLRFTLSDTDATVLILQTELEEKWQDLLAQYKGHVVTTNQFETMDSSQNHNPEVIVRPQHLAFVIYTSGSTGKPKGIMISHQQKINHLELMINRLSMTKNDKVAQTASLCFDISVWQMLSALLTGATTQIYSTDQIQNTSSFLKAIADDKVTILEIVPSLLNVMIKSLHHDKLNFDHLKYILTCGEAIPATLCQHWFELFDIPLINAYGPAECSDDVTFFVLKKGQSIPENIPVGKTLQNLQVYILDQYLNPCPIGVTGEICISGAGVARGYLNRADLTAAKFVPHPFLNEKDDKLSLGLQLYRSGDLGRYRSDGNIEFLGRIDYQMKIRGFRIEPGEIEATLEKNEHVDQTVILLREDEPGQQQLVAYITPMSQNHDQAVIIKGSRETFHILENHHLFSLTDELRDHLRTTLPEYMVPAFFVYLDRIPITNNGKIDRLALPAPDMTKRQVRDLYVPPQSPVEETLHTIWSEILRIDQIGVDDNFFKLGGHSLLATQVISRIRQIYDTTIPLRMLFEHPTLRSLSLTIEKHSQDKTVQMPVITPQKRPKKIPLSFAQQRLWFLDQLLPNTALYNIPTAVKLLGKLNLSALEQSLNMIVQRHEVLRTVFHHDTDGQASQVVMQKLNLDLATHIIDLQNLHEKERISKTEQLIKQEADLSFNLNTGPLIRAQLLRLKEQEHGLLITFHHIIADGWSLDVFFAELASCYQSLTTQKTQLPQEPAIQYVDFTLWQRNYLQGETLQRQLDYWEQELADIPELLTLDLTKNRPKTISYHGKSYPFHLDNTLKNKLQQLSQAQGASLFMTLLAIFQILLHRYSRQEVIVVGTPTANRHFKEIEELIGFFVNTLPMKTRFSGIESFSTILKRVKETALHAYQHQDVPFEQVVDHLRIERALNRNPIFQVLFDIENNANPMLDQTHYTLGDLQVSPLSKTTQSVAKVDLILSVREHTSGIDFNIQHATDIYDNDFIKQFAAHFIDLTKQICENINTPIHHFSLLTAEEMKKIAIWNQTSVDYPKRTVLELLNDQVRTRPNNIALISGAQHVSYKDLEFKTNQMAHYLQSLGVNAHSRVVLIMEKSIDMLIAIWGILKAQGAYVALDPATPIHRLEFVLEDVDAKILISSSYLPQLKNLQTGSRHLLLIDQCQDIVGDQPADQPKRKPQLENLAYIIYTSGSTGSPKGVMITHANLIHYLNHTITYPIKEGDTMLMHHSIAFDMSITSLFLPLIRGGTIEVLAEKSATDTLLGISDHLKDIDAIKLTPTHLKALDKDTWRQNGAKKPRCLIVGGESLQSADIEPILAQAQNTTIINEYGPTEATVGCCTFTITSKTTNTDNIPIGYPMQNTQIHILDANMTPVPIGMTGEIFIAGDGLSIGYLNRPDLTAEKFLPNPFRNENNGLSLRLYRSGDLAYQQKNGQIVYLGRLDSQVKIKGHRVELGEITHVLCQHLDVKNAVVCFHKESLINTLIAYVIPGDFKPSATELSTFLADKLPEYMVPKSFVFLTKLPMHASGKIDYRKLHKKIESQCTKDFVAPRSPIEKILSKLWSSLLSVDHISANDHFFRLGGDSILSLQMITQARRQGLLLNVQDIFHAPILCDLAHLIESRRNHKRWQLTPDNESDMPLLPIQAWFFNQRYKQPNHYNQSFLIKVSSLDLTMLKKTIGHIVERHPNFNLRFKLHDGKITQHYHYQAPLESLRVLDVRRLGAKEGSKEFEENLQETLTSWQSHFHIENGPLYSFGYLYGFIDQSSRIYIALHHLIVDTVSWHILLEDFKNLYLGHELYRQDGLANYQKWLMLPQQYRKDHMTECAYWQNIMSDHNDTSLHTLDQGTIERSGFMLDKKITAKLIKGCHHAYNTQINDLLLSALTHALADLTGETVHHVVLEGHGREDSDYDVDISHTLGWFTSMYPIRLEKHTDIGTNIQWTKEMLRYVPNKGMGYGMLTNYQTLPLILFNYLGQLNQTNENENNWTISAEQSGQSMHEKNINKSLIEINGLTSSGCLQFSIESQLGHKRTMKLSDDFKKHLLAIIEHCSKRNNHPTMSDFKDFEPYTIINPEQKETLFIFPPGEGGAESYLNNVAQYLPKKRLVLFNNYLLFLEKKLGRTHTSQLTYEQLAKDHLLLLKLLQPTGPYQLLGWSFGGILAFEISRHLHLQGQTVKQLIMVDALFNYRSVVDKTDTAATQSQSINYPYNPPMTDMRSTQVILFKALKIAPVLIPSAKNNFSTNDMYKVFKHYTQEAHANYLDILLPDHGFQVVTMNHDHYSWVHSPTQVVKICSAVDEETAPLS